MGGSTEDGADFTLRCKILTFPSSDAILDYLRGQPAESAAEIVPCSNELIEAGMLDEADRLLQFAAEKNSILIFSALARISEARGKSEEAQARWETVKKNFVSCPAG